MGTPDLLKWVLGLLGSLISAGFVTLWAWAARWKLHEISRERLVEMVGEQRTYIEEKEKLLAALRQEFQVIQQRCEENARRQEELDGQILELVRQRLTRDRWMKRVIVICEGAGVEIPPYEDG